MQVSEIVYGNLRFSWPCEVLFSRVHTCAVPVQHGDSGGRDFDELQHAIKDHKRVQLFCGVHSI